MLAHRTIVLIVLGALIPCLAPAIPRIAAAEVARAPGDPGGGQGNDGAVAIASVELVDVPGEMRARLLAGMQESMAALGVRAVAQDQVRAALRDNPDISACMSPACLKRLGAAVGAQRFLALRVTGMGANFRIELALYDGVAVDPVRRRDNPCDVCSYDDVVKLVGQTTKELLGPPPEMDVQITSAPAGATVSVDGREIGVTPYAGKLRAGPHTLRASLSGQEQAETSIQVKEEADGPQVFHISLTAVAVTVESSPRPYRLLKWLGTAATLGALGTGAGWLVVDGSGTCSDRPTCPEVYDTRTQGFIALGAGAALGAFTVWMFVRDRRDASQAIDELAVVPTRGGAITRLGWRF